MTNSVSIPEMAESLSETTKAVINENSTKIRIYADGGEDPMTHWFEIWQMRGTKPPRQLFSSPQQYAGVNSSLMSAQIFLTKVFDPKIVSCVLEGTSLKIFDIKKRLSSIIEC